MRASRNIFALRDTFMCELHAAGQPKVDVATVEVFKDATCPPCPLPTYVALFRALLLLNNASNDLNINFIWMCVQEGGGRDPVDSRSAQ